MAAFAYTALDLQGRKRKGVIEADSPRVARQQLRDKALTALSIDEAAPSRVPVNGNTRPSVFAARGARVSLRDVSVLTQQLAAMVQAGLPVEQALQALSRENDKSAVKSVLAAVRAHIMEGHSFAQSLGLYPRIFSDLYRTSVRAGEQSGHLDKVLAHLADFTERSYAMRQKILLALLYPAILTGVSLLIIAFLVVFIVPDLVRVFADAGHALPLLTRLLIVFSHFVGHYGVFAAVAVAGGIGYGGKVLRRPAMRLKLHTAMLGWPLLGPLVTQYSAARFAATLGMLQGSGVALIQALEIAGAVLANLHVRARVRETTVLVREGVSLSRAMERAGVFPPILTAMAASGEASGELGAMLTKAGSLIQRDVENRIAVLLGLFEPLVLLVMGGIVLLLVLAIILPTLSLNDLVK